jgi:hypothetical protein
MRTLDLALLQIPEESGSSQSSARSYSSASHDGLTDTEWAIVPAVNDATPACPPATPACAKDLPKKNKNKKR